MESRSIYTALCRLRCRVFRHSFRQVFLFAYNEKTELLPPCFRRRYYRRHEYKLFWPMRRRIRQLIDKSDEWVMSNGTNDRLSPDFLSLKPFAFYDRARLSSIRTSFYVHFCDSTIFSSRGKLGLRMSGTSRELFCRFCVSIFIGSSFHVHCGENNDISHFAAKKVAKKTFADTSKIF